MKRPGVVLLTLALLVLVTACTTATSASSPRNNGVIDRFVLTTPTLGGTSTALARRYGASAPVLIAPHFRTGNDLRPHVDALLVFPAGDQPWDVTTAARIVYALMPTDSWFVGEDVGPYGPQHIEHSAALAATFPSYAFTSHVPGYLAPAGNFSWWCVAGTDAISDIVFITSCRITIAQS